MEVFRFLYQPRPSAGAPTGALPERRRPKRKRDSEGARARPDPAAGTE